MTWISAKGGAVIRSPFKILDFLFRGFWSVGVAVVPEGPIVGVVGVIGNGPFAIVLYYSSRAWSGRPFRLRQLLRNT